MNVYSLLHLMQCLLTKNTFALFSSPLFSKDIHLFLVASLSIRKKNPTDHVWSGNPKNFPGLSEQVGQWRRNGVIVWSSMPSGPTRGSDNDSINWVIPWPWPGNPVILDNPLRQSMTERLGIIAPVRALPLTCSVDWRAYLFGKPTPWLLAFIMRR